MCKGVRVCVWACALVREFTDLYNYKCEYIYLSPSLSVFAI